MSIDNAGRLSYSVLIVNELAEQPKLPSVPKNLWPSFLCGVLGALAIFLLVFAVYRPILPGNFLMDDRRLVQTDNPLVNGELTPVSIWFQTDFVLSNLAFWSEWRAWGNNPEWYHVINIFLHALSAILLWRVLVRLKIPGAWFAAAIFAIHPVCVNSVARIAELKNTLSLPFFLLSFWLYIPSFSRNPHPLRYGLALVVFILALMSKTSTIMLPVVLLACAAWLNRKITREDLLRTIPFFVLSLAFGLMSAWFQKHQALLGAALPPESFWTRLAVAGRVFWFYLGNALWPLHLNLVYPHWEVDPKSAWSYAPNLLFCVVLFVCWRFRRGWGWHVLFGLETFAILLFPVLGLIDSQFLATWRVSDHLQYLPLIAPVTLAVAALAACLPAFVFRGVAGVFVLALSILTFQRAGVFGSEENLFHDTLAKNPAAWGAHNDLGVNLAAKKKYAEAVAEFKTSLKFNPQNADAESNLGQALLFQHKPDEAEPHFLAAIKIKPGDAEVHRRYAELLRKKGRIREAAVQEHIAVVLSRKPEVGMRLQYAGLLHQIGDVRGAMEQFRKVLAVQPDSVEALNNLAWLLATASDDKLRNGSEAVKLAEHASHLPPVSGMCVPGTLAAAYAEAGRFPDAIATARKAVQEEMDNDEMQFAILNRQLLKLYRAGKPFREPAPDPKRQ